MERESSRVVSASLRRPSLHHTSRAANDDRQGGRAVVALTFVVRGTIRSPAMDDGAMRADLAGAGGGMMQQRAGRRWGVGGGSAGQERARRGESEEARAGVKRTLAARSDARADGASRRACAARGHSRGARLSTGQGGGTSERDGTSPPNLPFGCAAPHAPLERSRDAATRGAVSAATAD